MGQCHLYTRNLGLLWIYYVYVIRHVNRGRGWLDVHRLELQRLQLQIFEPHSLELQRIELPWAGGRTMHRGGCFM